jgi:hypothetical protein
MSCTSRSQVCHCCVQFATCRLRTTGSVAATAVRPRPRAASRSGASAGRRPLVHSPRLASRCPACPSGPGLRSYSSPQAHLIASATLSAPGTRPGIRPVIQNDRPEGPAITSRFPSPLGRRHSRLGHPIPAEGLGLPHGRLTGSEEPDFDRATAFRTRELRPGWVPLYPEDDGARPAGSPPQPASAASQRQSLNPATTSHQARLSFTRNQQGFTHVHPSGLPLAHAPGMEPAALRLSPELRTPPSPAAHVEGRDRPSSTDLGQRSQHQSSLRSCVFTQCVRPRVARRKEGARPCTGCDTLSPLARAPGVVWSPPVSVRWRPSRPHGRQRETLA